MRVLIGVRLLVITSALVGGIFFYAHTTAFYSVLALCYAANFVNIFLLRWRSQQVRIGEIQIVADVILTTLLVHFTGGIDSALVLFYPLCILAALMMGPSPIFAQSVTVGCSLFYGMIIALECTGACDSFTGINSSYAKGAWLVAFLYFFRVLIFGIVCGMGSLLLRHLRTEALQSRRLHDASTELLTHMNNGVITADAQDRVIYANARGLEILGCSLQDLAGKDWRGLFADSALCNPALSASSEVLGGGKDEMHLEISCPDGNSKVVGLHFSQQYDEKGRLVQKVLMFRDLTEVLRMERKLKAAEKWALLGELAAGIVHEVRNPLSSMRGAIEVLKEKLKMQGKDAALLDIVLQESDRLNQILQDYLAYSQKRSTERKRWDLLDIVQHLLRVVQSHPRLRKDVRLHWECAKGDHLVWVDDQQIRQVLLNLIQNALDAMPEGGDLSLRMNFSENREAGNVIPLGRWVQLDVQDTGIGMTQEVMDRLYEPFFSTKQDGHGIGLALCRRIIEAHQGFLRVRSVPGKGTTFTVYLPILTEKIAERNHAQKESRGGYG